MSNKKNLEDVNLSDFWLIIVVFCALFGGC